MPDGYIHVMSAPRVEEPDECWACLLSLACHVAEVGGSDAN